MDTPRAPRLDRIPREIAAVADYEPFARACLDDNAWTYLAHGAADELTLRANREAFDRCFLEGRVLADVADGDTTCTLFGQPFAHPILLAPVAYQGLFHPDGERATVQAAGALEAGMVVSTLATTRLEEVAALGSGPLWFQLYVQPDRAFTLDLVRRAEAAGYQALVVTVDAPIAGVRNFEQRVGFHLPPGLAPVNLAGMREPTPDLQPGDSAVFRHFMRHAPTWRDLEALRAATSLPILLKGITSSADARRVRAMGLDGLIVSNHGGRTLDTLAPTLDLLPEVVAAVEGALPVLVDGGIRRGTDVLKALALGARAVLVGRAFAMGLAAAGPYGVAHVLRLLRDELEIAMALTGCRSLGDIGPHVLRGARR